MSPKEYASYLYGKFYGIPLYIKTVKQCCHIAVDEILKANPTGEYSDPFIGNKIYDKKSYYRQVKEEIDNI